MAQSMLEKETAHSEHNEWPAAIREEFERESVDAEVAGALIFELHPDALEADPR